MKKILAIVFMLFAVPACAQWQTPNHSVPLGRGGGVTGFGAALPGTAGLPLASNGPTIDPSFQTILCAAIGNAAPSCSIDATNANNISAGVLSVVHGGTGNNSAAGARTASGLNIDQYTPIGNVNYGILATDRTVGTSAAFTAGHTWTLPTASVVNPGQTIDIADFFGSVSTASPLMIQRAGTDTISVSPASVTSLSLTTAFSRLQFRSDGVSKWSVSPPGSAASTLIDLTKPPYNACTGGDDTVQILAWMNAASATGSTPGIAYVPPGTTCLFSLTVGPPLVYVHVPSSLTIWAYGATFKAAANSNANNPFCICATDQSSTGPSHVAIYGLKVDGNVANRTGPFSFGNFAVISADDVSLVDTIAVNCASDCYNITGNSTTGGLSHRFYAERLFGSGAAGAATRNIVTFDGVLHAVLHNCWLVGGGTRSPGAGIDIEPDSANTPDIDLTIDTCEITGNAGNAISVNPGAVAGAITVSQALNINASGNNTTYAGNDFQQFSTAATKAGFRFINAHGTFGGTTPAADALP